LKNKISNTSIKGGPNHERKIELRKQLDDLRNEQSKIRGGRGKTVEQLGTMQEALKKKVSFQQHVRKRERDRGGDADFELREMIRLTSYKLLKPRYLTRLFKTSITKSS